MPKSKKSKHTIFALDETTCQMEKITISSDTRRKFKDAGKVRKVFKPPKPEPIQTPTFSPERLQEIQQEHKEHLSSLPLLARLTSERKCLVDRLSDPPLPLIQRIEPHPYHIPPPIPNTLHFHQTKKLLRIKEFKELVEPTFDRIRPFFDKLTNEAKWGGGDEHFNPIFDWFYRLEDIVFEMDTIEMSNYTPFVPPNTLDEYDLNTWAPNLTQEVNLENIGWTEASMVNRCRVFHNAHTMTIQTVKTYIDNVVTNLNNHYNQALGTAYNRIAILEEELVAAITQVRNCQNELNRLPVSINNGVGKTKVPEPPTFAGSENKMHLEDWLNQVALYCSATGIINDHQKIVCALTRLRAPATTYMKAYFNNVQENLDLGTWDSFVQELKSIYGQRDDKEGAKKELTQLWANKDLAKKNFIKYVEHYRTLARIVNYTDEVHIDKLREVVPEELRHALVFYELKNEVPKDWDSYIKLLMNAYKALHPEKTQAVIFGNASGSGNKDPEAMEIDQAKKKKNKEVNSQEKVQKYCQICAGKGYKSKSKSHNTTDCYDKPGNEGKRPQKPAASSSSNKPIPSGSSNSINKGKSFKSRLLEMLSNINDDDDSETPSDVIDINSATIEEIPDPKPAGKKAIMHNDNALNGSQRLTGPKLKGRAQSGSSVPNVGSDNSEVVLESCVNNISRNKTASFKVPVTLWVYGTKVQTEALVDSGATTNFIDREFVKRNNLATNRLATPYKVINADGTPNKAGQITEYVRAYVEIGSHKSTHYLFVTQLGNKDMMIGYSYLYKHNPSINWQKGEWEFTRCPDTCAYKARKTQDLEAGANELQLDFDNSWESSLDDLGDEDMDNHYINWVDVNDPHNHQQAMVIASMFDKDIEEMLDDEDTKYWKSHVPEWLHEYGDVFSKTKSERMPIRKPYDHSIEFVEGAMLPKPAKVYPLSPTERNSLDTWIDEELRKGYIQPSTSPIAAPFFFVKKHDGSLRPVMDYRALNNITVKNRYPIPRISDLIESLSQASIFTKIDLRWGYNNVRIKKGDEWKTAFITRRGLFEANVMYFGFSNAPATFQSMMNNILEDLIRDGHVMVYLDDILIFGSDLKEHRKLVKEVLKRLQDNDLYAKAEKCFFEQSSIKYLGMIISKNQVAMDEEKLSGVLEWPVPRKVKQVQAFLGFANFYRRFIQNFAKIAKPLSDLSKKDKPWEWGEDQQSAFEALKKAFTTAPILRIPDDVNPFRLSTDASDFATGAVLSQLDPNDNLWHPVAFFSKSLDVHERNYEIYDKELLAIIRGLEEYRHHLEGHPEKFEIWSDHQNLTYFRSAQKLTRRQARWALYLTRFYYTLHHKPGKTMQAEDPLSRRSDHEEGVNFDNEDQILLKPEFFAVHAVEAVHESPINDEQILREVKQALLSDEVTKDYKSLLQSGPREFGKSLQDWNYENGLLLYRGKVYIPKSTNDHLRQRIVQIHHDLPSAGHPGRWKTYELVSRNYWWPSMSIFVKKYVTGCDVCQRMKNRPQQPFGPLMPNKVPNGPWEIISTDLITQLPESNGYDAICVVVDRLTKRAHSSPSTTRFIIKRSSTITV
ncbi:hypothetical protein NP233_g61 [Leucocoprinus birnbaumii]|uniref:Reverse transcriptase domain-containing protein n=1 Tax=Leucocoprinus birnbaumii TaxID=56174 RepID=A0AAD5W2Z8_9AGAR|nr:hypothetical protein NP233_g61 [Leucocoprinus birnbaumii]